MVLLTAEDYRGHPALPSACSSACSISTAAAAKHGRLQPGANPSTAHPASPRLRIHRQAPAKSQVCTAESPSGAEAPEPARLLELSSFGAQPERAERGQAGGPGYVMGFTGHQLSVLLFTLLSLAKCKRFFPSTVER